VASTKTTGRPSSSQFVIESRGLRATFIIIELPCGHHEGLILTPNGANLNAKLKPNQPRYVMTAQSASSEVVELGSRYVANHEDGERSKLLSETHLSFGLLLGCLSATIHSIQQKKTPEDVSCPRGNTYFLRF
jgi:hypothetical protein